MLNLTGVTSTAPEIMMQSGQAVRQPTAAELVHDVEQTTGSDGTMSNVEFSAQVSMQVLDMSLDVFEGAVSQLLASMAEMTGIGQNIDTSI